MQTSIEMYESQLRAITEVCADPWFAERLAECRAWNEHAAQLICGSCLRLVLDIAKKKLRPEHYPSLLDLVQEGNAALMETVQHFQGSTAQEFLSQVMSNVERRLDLFK